MNGKKLSLYKVTYIIYVPYIITIFIKNKAKLKNIYYIQTVKWKNYTKAIGRLNDTMLENGNIITFEPCNRGSKTEDKNFVVIGMWLDSQTFL